MAEQVFLCEWCYGDPENIVATMPEKCRVIYCANCKTKAWFYPLALQKAPVLMQFTGDLIESTPHEYKIGCCDRAGHSCYPINHPVIREARKKLEKSK